MNSTPPIELDKSRQGHTAKKFPCPSCRQKRFVRFFNFSTKEYLPDQFGRCDREEKCGYFEAPWNWLKEQNPSSLPTVRFIAPTSSEPLKTVGTDVVFATLQRYQENNLFAFIASKTGVDVALTAFFRYFVGTAKERGTIFWQVDEFKRVRTGQKILYDQAGHRRKDIEFPATRLYKLDDGYKPCFFGQHLLFDFEEGMCIGIVESEKTALICSIYLPFLAGRRMLWIGSGGVNGMTDDKIRCLEGLPVVLVPDFSFLARATWGMFPMRKKRNEKGHLVPDPDGELTPNYISAADKLRKLGCKVSFYDPLEHVTDGSDIADVLVEMPAPVYLNEADYDELGLIEEPKKEPSAVELAAFPKNLSFVAESKQSFKIQGVENGKVIVGGILAGGKEFLESFLSSGYIPQLIETLGMYEGSIEQK